MRCLLFRLNKHGTLTLSLFSSLLITFGGLLLIPFQFFNGFLELDGSELDMVFQMWPNKCQGGWNGHIPWSASCTLTAQDAVCFCCSKATLLTHTWLTLPKDFRVLLSRATLQALRPQLVLMLRIILARMQDFTFIFC